MKNLSPKNFDIPAFLRETMLLETKINTIDSLAQHMTEEIEKELHTGVIEEATKQFQVIIFKAHPELEGNPVTKNIIENLHTRTFKSFAEFRNYLAEILFRIYYSDGHEKVFDKHDPAYFDLEKFEALSARGYFITDKWMTQFIHCLDVKDAEEDMVLHSITPDWLWQRSVRMLLELYKLNQDALRSRY